ncbi:hypothetical protein O3M35_011213 [Rhynocoris fuscipes]|uniref:Longitudinals lacking protein n=1 Tax=Rhynocoris fuscipes TaxID=488301 RepID=A0AAW1CU98_9HEMI
MISSINSASREESTPKPRTRIHKKHNCRNCCRSYLHLGNLNKHLKYECGKEAQFQCPFCTYKGKQKSHIKQHIANRHPVMLKQSGYF